MDSLVISALKSPLGMLITVLAAGLMMLIPSRKRECGADDETEEKSAQRKKGKSISFTSITSCMLIALMVLSTASLAKYTVSSFTPSEANVARFSVSAVESTDQPTALTLDSIKKLSGEYDFEVYNNSSVAVNYTVLIKNLPDGVTAAMGDQTVTGSGENSTVKFDAANLGVEESKNCKIVFEALDYAKANVYNGIAIDVQFEQID